MHQLSSLVILPPLGILNRQNSAGTSSRQSWLLRMKYILRVGAEKHQQNRRSHVIVKQRDRRSNESEATAFTTVTEQSPLIQTMQNITGQIDTQFADTLLALLC